MDDREPVFYEPWRPRRDQRVITRISPECPQQYRWHGNYEQGSGMVGVVINDRVVGCPDGHPYLVKLDESPYVIWVAAAEIEPLS